MAPSDVEQLNGLKALLEEEGFADISAIVTLGNFTYESSRCIASPEGKKPESIDRLRLLSKLYLVVGRDVPALQLLAKKTRTKESGCTTLADIATRWPWQCKAPEDFAGTPDTAGWKYYKERIAEAEPTAVYRGMMKQGDFPIIGAGSDAMADETRRTTVSLFDDCVAKSIDISRDSTMNITDAFRRSTQLDSKVAELAIWHFQTIQRLQAVAVVPRHTVLFMTAGLYSAQAIARSDDKDLEPLAKQIGDDAHFRKIQDQALLIETRNEQAWLRLLQTRSQSVELATPGPQPSIPTGGKGPEQLSYQRIFNEVDNASCEHCASVLSPSAYFVDLLRMMDETTVMTPTDQKAETTKTEDKNPKRKVHTTLLQKFFERRGDLQTLKLSCANTNDLVDYSDLVHEVLQSFAASLAGEGGHFSDNTHKNAQAYHTRTQVNTDGDVWFDYEFHQKVTRTMVYPISNSNFPFNFATVSTRLFLGTLGSSLSDVYSTFGSTYRVFSGPSKQRLARLVLDRSLAAEHLGLNPEEFMLLSREAFWNQEAIELQGGAIVPWDYIEILGLAGLKGRDWASGAEWGYSDITEYVTQDESKFGLMFVQSQLLPRSGLDFQELLAILKTQYMRRQLVLVPASGKFTGRLEDIRLRKIPDATHTGTFLTEYLALDLIKFVRLYQKLQWPINELDCAVMGIVRMIQFSKANRSIDASVLVHLSWVKQFKDLTGLAIPQLMALWADIDASHPNSLYHSLFTQQSSIKNSHLFLPAADGAILGQFAELQDGSAVIASALGISESELPQLMAICSLGQSEDLNLSNVSKLYRYRLLSKILNVDFLQLQKIFRQSESLSYLESPESTYKLVKHWDALTSTGLSAAGICAVLTPLLPTRGLDPAQDMEDLGKYATKWTHGAQAEDNIKSAILADDSKVPEAVLQIALDQSKDLIDMVDDEYIKSNYHSAFLVGKQHVNLVLDSETHQVNAALGDDAKMDDKSLIFEVDIGVDLEYWTKTIALQEGQAHYIESTSDLRQLLIWIREDKTKRRVTPFLRPTAVIRKFRNAIAGVRAALKVIQHFNIIADETHIISEAPPKGLGINLNELIVNDLFAIRQFASLRQQKTRNKPVVSLSTFWHSLLDLKDESPQGSVSRNIAQYASAPLTLVADILREMFPNMKQLEVRDALMNLEGISSVFNIIKFVNKPRFATTDVKLLFRIADPPHPIRVDRQFGAANDLRNEVRKRFSQAPKGEVSLYSATTRKLVSQCRTVLVQYLLNSEFAKKTKCTDADSLFEYFLIDVNMGPGLKTSRIKQAISTAQLYIQRCLLGMETENGISKDIALRKNWDWCRSYQLWEASRKVFLYPENYADPTLRDDKSEIFRALEAKVIQSSLDTDSMLNIIKSYIYEVNTLSDLEVQAYFLDNRSRERHITFHLFARTRSSPYNYYYRPLKVHLSKISSDSVNYWSPWEKLEIEMPTYENYADGTALPRPGTYLLPVIRKGRLYLFIPQILLKTLPSTKTSNLPLQEIGKSGVNETAASKYWEIRMGVTEYRNGHWSPKKLSTATLAVNAIDVSQLPEQYGKPENIKTRAVDKSRLPSIDSFKFFIRSEDRQGNMKKMGEGVDAVLDIDVESWYPKNLGWEEPALEDNRRNLDAFVIGFGRFQIREYDIIAIPGAKSWSPTRDNTRQTIPTKFSKLRWDCTFNMSDPNQSDLARPTNVVYHGGTDSPPILPDVLAESKSKQPRVIIWTMNFDDTQVARPTGLVVEMVTREEGSLSYLTLPTLQVTDDEDEIEPVAMNNNIGPLLMELCGNIDDIDQLYKSLNHQLTDQLTNDAFGASASSVFHELAKPYSIYNWELSFHAVSLLMERLLATQQLDLALHVAQFVFDPTAGVADPTKCWRFAPFRDPGIATMKSPAIAAESVTRADPPTRAKRTLDAAVNEWREHPFAAHVVARAFPTAYMKRIVRKYIEILVAMGDKHFREGTLESMPLAIQRYIEASHLFGERPKTYERFGKAAHKSYQQLTSNLNSFSNSVVDMELEFPFWCNNKYKGTATTSPKLKEMNKGLLGVLRTGYFCVPQNPELVALRDLIDDRLFKIRNCQDINGKGVQLRLFEPPLDPAALVRAVASGMSPSAFMDQVQADYPRHRFTYLLQKALEVCSELNTMGDLFVSIKERKDAEALAAFRSAQDDVISAMVLNTKKHELAEARKTLESLEETRRGHESRLSFYRRLVGEDDKTPTIGAEWHDIVQDIEAPSKDELRMNSNEQTEFYLTDEAEKLNLKASSIDTVAGALRLLPGVEEDISPMGCGVTMKMDGNNIADFMMVTSGVFRLTAEMKNWEASRASRKAALVRQLQERRLQANLAGRDIAILDKQIAAQEIRVKMAESEVSIQEKQIEQSNELDAWLKNKYSNEQLYNWMANSVASIFKEGYTFAAGLAARAKRAYEYETGTPPDPNLFGKTSFWDDSRDGLFSAQNLWFALKRMEDAFSKDRPHDFEISKTISLRQIDPLGMLKLRATGSTIVKIPEVLFDMDFPGHYMRRIKSVGLSIPCIVDPYTGINCELSLTKNMIRKKEMPSTEQEPEEPFRTIPIKGIATSHGQADSGTFELSYGSETYGPFEGAGVISDWSIELTSPIPQFDYGTISDVVMHMRYTSKAPAGAGKKNAAENVRKYVSAQSKDAQHGLQVLLDVRNDCNSQWRELNKALQAGTASSVLEMKDIPARLPFWTRGKPIFASTVSVVAEFARPAAAAAGKPAEVSLAPTFKLGETVMGPLENLVPQEEQDKANSVFVGAGFAAHENLAAKPLRLTVLRDVDKPMKALERLFVVVDYRVDVPGPAKSH